jgi:putative membrane protein
MSGLKWIAGVMLCGFLVAPLALQSGEKKNGQKDGDIDTKFVMKASESDIAEIALGKLASQQASNAKVREFAMHMVSDHTKCSEELQTIAKKHNLELAREMSKQHKNTHEKLSKLKGAEFDREYMTGQVKAHQEAVTLFQEQSKSGRNPDLKAFATKSLPTIEKHLKMAQEIAGNVGK